MNIEQKTRKGPDVQVQVAELLMTCTLQQMRAKMVKIGQKLALRSPELFLELYEELYVSPMEACRAIYDGARAAGARPNKVSMIREYRSLTGEGLTESKRAIEDYFDFSPWT